MLQRSTVLRSLAVVLIVAIIAHPGEAATFDGPVSVEFEVSPPPASGGTIAFDVVITAVQPVDGLQLELTAAGIVNITSATNHIHGALDAGEGLRFSGSAALTGIGAGKLRASVTVVLSDPCGTESAVGRAAELYVIDDGTYVGLGDGSDTLAEEHLIWQLLDAGMITQDQADARLEAMVTLNVSGGAEMRSLTGGSGDVITLSGTAQWADEAGGLHNARHCVVKVTRPGLLFGRIDIAQTTVDQTTGAFSFSLDPGVYDLGSSPRRLYVAVLADNPAGEVKNPGFLGLGRETYRIERDLGEVANGASLAAIQLHGTTAATADDTKNGAFSIVDSLLVTQGWVQSVTGTAPAKVDVKYPVGGTVSTFGGTTANILRADRNDWDVIHHEYGHYVASLYDLDNIIGDHHDCGDNLIIRYNKDKGTRLAWGEGLATWFGIAAQLRMNAGALGVPRVGDTVYQDTDDSTLSANLESRDHCVGRSEGNENNSSRCLWDVSDGAVDGDDEVAFGFDAVFSTLQAGHPGTLSDTWNALIAGQGVGEKILLGAIFAQNQVSPKQTAPSDGASLVVGGVPPTFRWEKNGLNDFQVKFYDESFNEVFASPELGDVSDWTPPQADWNTIAAGGNTVLWVVEGRNTDDFETGRYWSGSRKLGGVDFAFVIDDTGSMSEEIGGVRNALLNFLAGFDPASTSILFQLTTFKDNVSVRAATRDLATIQAQVSGLYASGGGDCPEQSAGGLSQGTLALKRGGTVLFATDADPRPGSDLPALLAELRSRGARVNVLLSGTCTGSALADADAIQLAVDSATRSQPGAELIQYNTRDGFAGAIDAFSQVATATGGAFAYVPEVNSGGDGAVEYQKTAENILAACVGPRIVLATPSQIRQGATGVVTLEGQNTSFLSSTTVAFSAGISVSSVEVLDAITLTVNVQVAIDAELGFKDVTVQTPLNSTTTEVALGIGLIRVMASTAKPVLVTANPSVVQRGVNASVDIHGLNTTFSGGDSTVSFGPGITIDAFNVISQTHARADISVAADAAIGFRNVAVTTGAELAANEVTEFFRVQEILPPIPVVDSVVPEEGHPAEVLELHIEVSGIELETDGTTVEFSGAGIAVDSVLACGDSLVALITVDADALPGIRDVIVSSGGQTATKLNGFNVLGLPFADCNNNSIDDQADIAAGTSEDCNANGVPDECDPPFTLGDCPATMTVQALDAAGIVVHYVTPLTENGCDPTVVVQPPSGSLFPVGATQVTVTATDSRGTILTCAFNVVVLAPGQSGGPPPGWPSSMFVPPCCGLSLASTLPLMAIWLVAMKVWRRRPNHER